MNVLLIIYVVAGRRAGLRDGRAGSGRCAFRDTRRHDRGPQRSCRCSCRSGSARRSGCAELALQHRRHGVALVAALFVAVGIGEAQAAPGEPGDPGDDPEMDAAARAGLRCSTSRSASSPWRSAPRVGVLLGLAQISLLAAGARLLLVDDAVLPQLAVAGAACSTACCCCRSRCRSATSIVPLPGWLKATIGLSLPVMANVSELVRGAVLLDPVRAVGSGGGARLLAPPDAVDDHPAAMREAHDCRRG